MSTPSCRFSLSLCLGIIKKVERFRAGPMLRTHRHLRQAVKEYMEHYHVERNHQGLDNRLIEEPPGVVEMNSAVIRHERLGGVLNYYERTAA